MEKRWHGGKYYESSETTYTSKEDSYMEMETTQIKGIDSTNRGRVGIWQMVRD